MIKQLTDKQKSLLPVYRDKWLDIGLSTEPLDFEKAKLAAIKCYQCAGLKPPEYFYQFQSPLSAAIGSYLMKKSLPVKIQPGDQVWSQVWDRVKDQVRGQVWDQVGSQVWDQVWDRVRDQVRGQVWDQVRDRVRDQVGDQVRDQVGGCHDAYWLGFYEYFMNVMGIEMPQLNGLIELSKVCGWWAPYKNAVILQDRPKVIKFDDQKRLHCEKGPCIEYKDGFSIYCWHGTRIPETWIKQKPSAQDAIQWENLEQRRAACEIVGWHTILDQLNAVSINKDKDETIGELLEVNLPDIGTEKFLKVKCGTGRTFALPVPPEMKTAHEANAWTYGLAANDYRPEIRT